MFGNIILGAILGALGCLYFLAKKKSKKDGTQQLKGEILFLNILILDKTEAVQKGVADKVQNKLGTGFFRDKIASKLGAVAAKNVSDEKVAETIGSKVSEIFPAKLAEVGLTAEATKVFCKGPYLVVRIHILDADLRKLMVVRGAGEEKANVVEDMLNILGGTVENTLQSGLLSMIATNLQEVLPPKMTAQFEEKGLKADIHVKTAAEQAVFFFDSIADMHI